MKRMFAMLLVLKRLPIAQALIAEGLGALVGTAVELFTPSKYDTVTVPAAIVTLLLLVAC